jgi:hypothetical protein
LVGDPPKVSVCAPDVWRVPANPNFENDQVTFDRSALRSDRMGKNPNIVVFEIEYTFSFGMSGNIIPCMRNAYYNDVGGYMKGRSVDLVKGQEQWIRPSLPPNDRCENPAVRGGNPNAQGGVRV